MGHSDIKTSMTYVHVTGMQLREALECVPSAKVGQRADTRIAGA